MFGLHYGFDVHEHGHIMDWSMDYLWTTLWT